MYSTQHMQTYMHIFHYSVADYVKRKKKSAMAPNKKPRQNRKVGPQEIASVEKLLSESICSMSRLR